MLQKEVVERMVAAPGDSDFGRLSVMLQYRFELEKLLDVPALAFDPVPKVDSAVIRLTPLRPQRCVARDESAVRARGRHGVLATPQDPAQFAAQVDRRAGVRCFGHQPGRARAGTVGRAIHRARRPRDRPARKTLIERRSRDRAAGRPQRCQKRGADYAGLRCTNSIL